MTTLIILCLLFAFGLNGILYTLSILAGAVVGLFHIMADFLWIFAAMLLFFLPLIVFLR